MQTWLRNSVGMISGLQASGVLMSKGHHIHVFKFSDDLGKLDFRKHESKSVKKTAKKLTFDGQSFDCHWQIARSKGQIANGKCQGPMANSQGQIANSKMQWPRAKGQWIGARGKGFHTRNSKKAIKNCEIHENRGFRWQGFRLPDMNCHGSGAKSDLPMPGPKGQPMANCNVQWPGAKGTGGQGFHTPKLEIH